MSATAFDPVVLGTGHVATTDRAIAHRTLEVLHSVLPRSALLHGAERFSENRPMSDLDVAVDGLSRNWHGELVAGLAEAGQMPLVVWPYDSGAVTLFLATDGLAEGVQLDLLFSPSGEGRYGFRSTTALRDTSPRTPIDSLSPVDSWLYQVQKRWMKGQRAQLDDLISSPPADREVLLRRTCVLFAGKHVTLIRALIEGHEPVGPGRHLFNDLPRITRRLITPAGLWVHSQSPDGVCAKEIHRRLSRFLLRTSLLAWPSRNPLGRIVDTQRIARLRWRAGVAVTFGPRTSPADIDIASADLLEAAEQLRASAAKRALDHLARLQWSTTE